MHDFLTVGAAAPLQEAAVSGLELPATYYEELREGYTRRREVFLGLLEQADLQFVRPQGAYYVLIDISKFGFENDTKFCRWLAQEIGVAAVPGSSFFREPINHLIRLHFAKNVDTLQAAGARLQRLKSL